VALPAGVALRVQTKEAAQFVTFVDLLHQRTLYEFEFQGRLDNKRDEKEAASIAATIRFGSPDQANETSNVGYLVGWNLSDKTARGTFGATVYNLRFENGNWHAELLLDNQTDQAVRIFGVFLLRSKTPVDHYSPKDANPSLGRRFSPTPPGWTVAATGGTIPPGTTWHGTVSNRDSSRVGRIIRVGIEYELGSESKRHRLWIPSDYLQVPLPPPRA
jgi:hypothetical protein